MTQTGGILVAGRADHAGRSVGHLVGFPTSVTTPQTVVTSCLDDAPFNH